MKIDTLSMLIGLTILCIGFSITMLLVWRFLVPMRALLLWGCGMGCYGFGVLFITLRDQVPDILSLPVGNLLLLCCYSLIWIGISLYRGKAPWYRTILLILLLFIPCYSWFVWGSPNIALRTVLVRLFLLMFLFGILGTLIGRRSHSLSFIERAVVCAFILDFVLRLGLILIQMANLSHLEPLQKNMITAVSSIFSMVTMVSWGMAVLLLAFENITHDLQAAVVEREEQINLNLLHQQRLQALLEISQHSVEDIQGLLDFALEKVIQITGSQFGYIYHYHEEQKEFVLNSWSKGVMPACSVLNPQTLYQLDKTGIWGEVVRQRRTILINDFAAPDSLKKGYPEGHVQLSRFLTIPVFDIDQKIVAVVGVANKEQPYTEQDATQLELMMAEVWRISKRLELEQRLIRAGREWQTTFDAISDSVVLLDLDQRILRCNLASTRLFGRSYNEIINHHCYKLVHGSTQPIDDCPMVRALISRKSESQLIIEGGRWLHVTVDPLLDGQGEVTGAVHIVHDDTERVTAEQAKLELLAMLEAVHNELYVFSPDTLQFEYVNQTAQQNLGYSQKQLLQMTPLDLKPMVRQELIMQIAPLLSGNVKLNRFETMHRRADGSQYPVEVNLQLVKTHFGNRCLAVVHDITQRKSDAQSLLEMQAQLLQNEKMASIGQLSAGIAHEINNPMGFINSNLGTLEKYVEKFDRYISCLEEGLRRSGSPSDQQEAETLRKNLKLDYVQRDIHQLLVESADGAERVMKIVQDLKTFARSDSSKIGRADINQCLDSTINIIWNQIKYLAELQRDYGDLPKLSCNIQQLNQVFMNLLINACHAIEACGAGALGRITVRTRADDEHLCISISDTGCGMSEELQRRIFEPFFTTKEVGKGTGLGLSISYDIIKKHGGEILVESREGAGTTFTVRMPLNPPELQE